MRKAGSSCYCCVLQNKVFFISNAVAFLSFKKLFSLGNSSPLLIHSSTQSLAEKKNEIIKKRRVRTPFQLKGQNRINAKS